MGQKVYDAIDGFAFFVVQQPGGMKGFDGCHIAADLGVDGALGAQLVIQIKAAPAAEIQCTPAHLSLTN